MPDRRTTPRWLRVPAVLVMLLAAAYQAGGMRWGARAHPDWPDWLKARPYLFSAATWTMFSDKSTTHVDVQVDAWRGFGWERVDAAALFPSRWESGPRYVRRPLLRSVAHRRTFAQAVCGRLPEPAEGVRISKVRWPKVPGQAEQPRDAAVVEPLTTWRCGEPWPLPAGRRL